MVKEGLTMCTMNEEREFGWSLGFDLYVDRVMKGLMFISHTFSQFCHCVSSRISFLELCFKVLDLRENEPDDGVSTCVEEIGFRTGL